MFRLLFKSVFLLILAGFISYSAADAFAQPVQPVTGNSETHQTLTKIQKRYKELKSLSCMFSAESRNTSTGLTDKMEGQLYLQFPEKMRWEYTQPKQTVIYDGTDLFIYFEEDKQVFTGPGDSINGLNMALTFFTGTDEMEKHFNVLPVEQPEQDIAKKYKILKLIPKTSGSGVDKIVMRWDTGSQWITGLTVTDSYGNDVAYHFQSFEKNPSIKKRLFKFKIPRDCEVFDLEGNQIKN